MKSILAPLTNVKFLMAFMLLIAFVSCSKEHSLENASVNGSTGRWEFTENDNNYMGDIDSSYIIEGGFVNELHIIGHVYQGIEEFHLVLYADSFRVGTYKTSTFTTSFEYGNQPEFLYQAEQSTGEFVVNITSSTGPLIVGDFSGKALKDGSSSTDIVKGSFTLVMPQTNIPDAIGIMGSESGICLPSQVFGTYQEAHALTDANTIEVQVNVASPGNYTIYTDPVNGISFKGTGVFTNAGVQKVTLKGSGVPVFEGQQQFIVHFGNSSCTFRIEFLEETASTDFDYFPSASGNWWQFTDAPSNVYFRVTNQTATVDGSIFQVIGEYPNLTAPNFDNAILLRKNNGNYYQVIDYSSFAPGSDPQPLETVILKDNVPQGTTWDSPDFSIKAGEETQMAFIKFTISAKSIPQAAGGFNFPDIIKVKGEIIADGAPTGIVMEDWYARNVGRVYSKDFSGKVLEIQDYRIF